MTDLSAADEKTAEKLFQAYVHKQQIDKEQIPASLDKQQAYGIQRALTAKKIHTAGEELKGYKVSLTSPETQKLFNSTTPLYGALMSSALSDGIIELAGMSSPLIEIELIFIAQEDLSPPTASLTFFKRPLSLLESKCRIHVSITGFPKSRLAK
ncbi:hypothetical protein [Planococcus koreensis]|uniref:hypothetical protein n=1 Tax=Planococcus koreensis TaxID=112331 RepID=UPI0039FC5084